ncbi:MAG: Tad domain-containing protein, partial [Schwartzia sp.]|nr:Tad domain-containing protein [Schwartzia sp. (in: firmicutes)]
MMGIKAFRKSWKQAGGVIVLTALALPFFLACVGLAVDVGNLYIHRSRLQNTADAAALAGGREFANRQETVDAHPQADTEARSYTTLDMATLTGGALTDQQYKAQQTDDDTILYGVRLTENVPLYFMRVFGLTDAPVVADAAVAIGLVGSDGGNGNLRDLFLFRHKLKIVNSIENPDLDQYGKFSHSKVKVTFDGNIAFTDGTGKNVDNASNFNYDELQYSTQAPTLDHFFTEKARAEGVIVQDAIDSYKNDKNTDYAHPRIFEDYDMDDLGASTRSLLNLPQEVSAVSDWSDW